MNYGYDARGRLGSVAYTLGAHTGSVAYGYLADSDLLETSSFSNGTLITSGYEPNRNLKTLVRNQSGTVVISQYDYTYDDGGRRETLMMSGAEFAKSLNEKANAQWFQNAQNTGEGIEILPDSRSYTYDPIGNRKTMGDWNASGAAPRSTTYAPNGLNQYDSRTVDGSVKPLIYDLDGNVTDDNSYRYTWDGENRLRSAESRTPVENSFRYELKYDYLGRRVERRLYSYQSGQWVDYNTLRYIYDGWNLVQIVDSGLHTQYVWGLDQSGTLQGAGGIGGLLAIQYGADVYHYTYDGNGNVSELVKKSDGAVSAHYEYDPYGNIVYSSGATVKEGNSFRFSTKYRDLSTGLYYYGYRYYNPTIGRWLNRDPIEEKGGLNLYGFVGNDPINLIDLLGQTNWEFKKLYNAYQDKEDLLSSQKFAQWILNAINAKGAGSCAARLSNAFNKAGYDLLNKAPKNIVVSDANGNKYILGAEKLARHIDMIKNEYRVCDANKIRGKEGIIYFENFHIDLYDGSQMRGNGALDSSYTDKPMWFMELK